MTRPVESSIVYLSLGANIGDRERQLMAAVDALQAHPGITVKRVSPLYETAPVGGPPDQPDFLNAVVAVDTDLPPSELLALTQSIEQKLGRTPVEPNGPRTIDIDILQYDRAAQPIPRGDAPILPHPRMHARSFVLQPLADIAPAAVHPGTNRTIADLLSRCDATHTVRRACGADWWPQPAVKQAR